MSHIPGHWQDDDSSLAVGAARAKEKFGILKPSDHKENPIDFPILFFNNRNYRREDYDKTKYDPKIRIGFHLALIPFEDESGKVVSNLAIAYDIVDYQQHLKAEREFRALAKRDQDLYIDRDAPIEKYSSTAIKKILKKCDNAAYQRIMEQTSEYVNTSAFTTIYKDDATMWIQNAIKKKRILKLSDYCRVLIDKLKILL